MSLRRLARHWNRFAEVDPMWAVLTWADKKGGRWAADAFFATGREEIDAVLAAVRATGPLRTERALDFGCGVGRLTRALAAEFDEVHGVDVAARMVDAARELAPAGHYHLNERADLALFPDAHFDFVYSSLTLQHMPPALSCGYVREFLRVLRPGGVLVVQIPERPTRPPNPRLLLHRLGVLGSRGLRCFRGLCSRRPVMDMFGVPRAEVEALLAPCAECRVVASTMAGPDWVAWRYLARK